MNTRRRSLVVVLMLAALAACGGSAGHASGSAKTGDPIRTFANALRITGAAKTARESVAVTAAVGGDETSVLDTEGVFAIDGSEADYHAIGGEIRFDGLIVDKVLYYAYPKMPPGKKWVRLDPATVKAQTGIDLGAVSQQSGDASQALRLLSQRSGAVATIGSEPVRGAATTHYRAPVDIGKAAADSKVLSGPALRLAQRLGVVPFDVWVDAQGRVRRLRYAIPGDRLGSSDVPAGALFTYTFELWDFGTPVHVVTPPANQVIGLDAYRNFVRLQGRPAV